MDEQSSFAVIDSNIVAGRIPAKEYLQARGANGLSFLALTHLHSDHFQGLAEIAEAFPPEKLVLTPHLGHSFADFLNSKLPLIREGIRKLASRADSAIDHSFISLIKLLTFIKRKADKDCLLPCGPDNKLLLRGFYPEVSISVIQPLSLLNSRSLSKCTLPWA